MNPGVQKPHWMAPLAMKAHWRAWSFVGVPIPSMVRISAPSLTFRQGTMQERVTLPSRMTLQTPHWPTPQPSLVPVSLSWFRMTLISFSSGSATTRWGIPLTRIVFT